MKRLSVIVLALTFASPLVSLTGALPAGATSPAPPPRVSASSVNLQDANVALVPGALVAGKDHVCFVDMNALQCAGENGDGQLGDGTTTDVNYGKQVEHPTTMMTFRNVFYPAAGSNHTCLIGSDQKVYCWGDNQYGQVGDGTTTDRSTPTLVADNANSGFTNSSITKLAAGNDHTCVIKGGSLYCWGLNTDGQLGNGTTTNSSLPVKVGGHFATQSPMGPLALGGAHSCATSFTGNYELWCWGDNQYGQVGDGSNSDRLAPTIISTPNVRNAQHDLKIAASESSTCLTSGIDGKIYCWGRNHYGQVGDGTRIDRNSPVAIADNGTFVNNGGANKGYWVAGGGHTFCVVQGGFSTTPATYSAHCWGSNQGGVISGSSGADETKPVAIPANPASGFDPTASFSNGSLTVSKHASAGFACVRAWCWGSNTSGQLATGNTNNSALATRMKRGSTSGGSGGGGSGGGGSGPALPTLTGTVEEVAGPGIKVTVSDLRPGARLDVQVSPASYTPTGPNSEMPRSLTGAVDQNSVTVTSIRWVTGNNPSTVIRTDSLQAGVTYRVGFSQILSPNLSSLTFRNITLTGNVGSSSGATSDASKAPAAPAGSTAPTAPVPGVTVTDSKVYTAAAPRRVASGSAISVLTPAQVKTQTLRTQTPAVCVPTIDDIVFIDEGRCNASVLDKKTGEVLRRIRTTVIEEDVVELGVGNEIVTLAPIFFENGSSTLTKAARARIAALRSRISAAGTVMVIGHSGTMLGNTPENQALSQSRAVNTVREMRRIRATGPFYSVGVGALDPIVRSTDRADQAKNRRVVIVLIP